MGIVNIHILQEPDDSRRRALQAEAARAARLMSDHRKGKHPYGSMRRDCPLCQAGK